MSIRNSLDTKRNRLSLALIAALAQMAAGAALAQGTAAAPAEAQATDDNAGKIVVTGSRIRRDNYNSVSPVTIITSEETTLAGFATTAETLQGTGATGGQGQINNAFGGFVVDGGPGANTIGLRGFTPTRSLVLLNGRRVSPSGTRGSVGAADLNVLPDAIVDHIEILKDGASSIYGSDAVAGVINVVTKKKIDGFTIDATHQFTDDGGGERNTVALIAGKTWDRFSISGAFEAHERDALNLGDRDWTRCDTQYRRDFDDDGNPLPWESLDFIDPTTGKSKCFPTGQTGMGGVTINTIGTATASGVGAAGSVGTRFNRWRPNPAITTGIPGYEGVGGGANSLQVRDTFEPRMLNQSLISPGKMQNLFVQGSYDLRALGDAEAYFEILANHRESSQVGYRQLTLDYPAGSPLIPPELAFSLFSLPTAITNGELVGVRAFIGFGNSHSSQSVDFRKVTTGLRGDFVLPGWDYDVAVSNAHSSGDYTFETFLTDRLAQSLDVVATGSGFACADPSNGCVAAPVLNHATVGGQFPADFVNWMWRPITGNTKYDETTVSFNISGTLFKMPYGKVRSALGAEYRHMKINDQPPADMVSGNTYNLTSAAPTKGSDSVRELYGEIEIPLLSGLKGAEELTMNMSARYTDYKSYGSDSTYKLGAIWTPVRWLTFRASHGTSYRAPALYEQFLGATTGFLSSTTDPCNNWDAPDNAGTPNAANCASEGLPAGFTQTNGVTVVTAGGAAQGLKAETSKNLTFGIVMQPELGAGFGNLSLAVDYFDIKVDNGVARAGAGNVLNLCYDDPDFRAGGGFCRLVERDANNRLTVLNNYVNLATDIVRGFDYTARYTRNIGAGKFRANLSITQFDKQANKLFADDPLDNFNGTINSPKYSGTLDLTYEYQDWTFRYGLDWIGAQSSYDYFEEDPATSTYQLAVPDYYLHGVSVRYKRNKWEVTAGVRNLANKEPPKISAGIYNRVGNAPLFSGYDYFGRTFFLNVIKSF